MIAHENKTCNSLQICYNALVLNSVLQGRERFPTGGIVRELAAEPV